MRLLYILMQISAILLMGIEFFRYTVDQYIPIIRNSTWCTILSYAANGIPGFYYSLYLFGILQRLDSSFKDSYLSLSKRTVFILRTLILCIPTISTISLLVDDPNLDCIRTWIPPDTHQIITYCIIPSESLLAFRYHIVELYVAVINILNITFGVMFSVKLRQFLQTGVSRHYNTKQDGSTLATTGPAALIIKNNILTIIGSISSISGYALYAITQDLSYVLMDVFVNTMVIGLMFKCNLWYYQRLCGPCARLSFKLCNGHNTDRNDRIEDIPMETPVVTPEMTLSSHSSTSGQTPSHTMSNIGKMNGNTINLPRNGMMHTRIHSESAAVDTPNTPQDQ